MDRDQVCIGVGMSKLKIDKMLEEAKKNVNEDREATKELLSNLISYMAQADERCGTHGPVAAKYVEVLQKSNDQLVKIAALISKNTKEDNSISAQELDSIFDKINEKSED